jgi:hypothetical protein
MGSTRRTARAPTQRPKSPRGRDKPLDAAVLQDAANAPTAVGARPDVLDEARAAAVGLLERGADLPLHPPDHGLEPRPHGPGPGALPVLTEERRRRLPLRRLLLARPRGGDLGRDVKAELSAIRS